VLWGYAVANLPMATSTSLLYLVPAFAVLIGFVWLGEVPLVGELLGGVVVIAGVVLVSLGDRILARVRRADVASLVHARPAQDGRPSYPSDVPGPGQRLGQVHQGRGVRTGRQRLVASRLGSTRRSEPN
jgi:EamA-like transporter family